MSNSQSYVEKKKIELSAIHNFAAKLCQPEILPRVKKYVLWQAEVQKAIQNEESLDKLAKIPEFAPVSINLDITTACNYACPHCVDMKILNTSFRYEHEKLLNSLKLMAEKGLRSVIVIGGGEPTLYPKFQETIRFMKSLGLQVSIVSNGSGNAKILEIADCLEKEDWVRLSLDSGGDEVFQAMHKPKIKITLDEICEYVPKIKEINSSFNIGISYVVTWKGACINDTNVVENLYEISMAAERAKKYKFNYISFKPFLSRAEMNNAEIVDLDKSDAHFEHVISVMKEQLAEADRLVSDDFKVHKTTNLKMLLKGGVEEEVIDQPQKCHMQFFRQILSPLGIYNCPSYRNQPHGKLGAKDDYAAEQSFAQTLDTTASMIDSFNATKECKEVTCLYNHVNWWIEDLIANPEKLDQIEVADIEEDYFL